MAEPRNPLVEVFVTHYNNPFLERTLSTLFAQTYSNRKIILSDNASTDGSGEKMAAKFPGLEVRRRFPGSGELYKHCEVIVPEAKAEYVAIFHNDDLYDPTILEKQVAFLEAHPTLNAVVTGATAIDENDRELWPIRIPRELKKPVLDRQEIYEYTLKYGNSFLVCPSALFRTRPLQKLGGFKGHMPYCADLDLWLRILFEGGGLGYLDEPLIRYRFSTRQGSTVYEHGRTEQSEFFDLMASYLARYPVSEETRAAHEALRRLDLFLAGVNRRAKGEAPAMLREHLEWLAGRPEQVRRFGGVDRLRVGGAKALSPLFDTPAGPWLARTLMRQTDPKISWPIRWALKARRWVG